MITILSLCFRLPHPKAFGANPCHIFCPSRRDRTFFKKRAADFARSVASSPWSRLAGPRDKTAVIGHRRYGTDALARFSFSAAFPFVLVSSCSDVVASFSLQERRSDQAERPAGTSPPCVLVWQLCFAFSLGSAVWLRFYSSFRLVYPFQE